MSKQATHIRVWSNNPNDVYFACGVYWPLRDKHRPQWVNDSSKATCKACLKWLKEHPDTKESA